MRTQNDFYFSAAVLSSVDGEALCEAFGIDYVDDSEIDEAKDMADLVDAIQGYRPEAHDDGVWATHNTETACHRIRRAVAVAE